MNNKKTLTVRCDITGEESIYSGDYLKKQIEKFKSVDNLKKYYITFKAKKLLFKGYSIQEIRNILVTEKQELLAADSVEINELVEYWLEEKKKNSEYNIKNNTQTSLATTDEDVASFISQWKLLGKI